MRDDPEFGSFWQTIFDEYELSCTMLLKVSGQQKLLETNATSRKSIKLREQIVLPLITIQQYALMRIRADKKQHQSHYRHTQKNWLCVPYLGTLMRAETRLKKLSIFATNEGCHFRIARDSKPLWRI